MLTLSLLSDWETQYQARKKESMLASLNNSTLQWTATSVLFQRSFSHIIHFIGRNLVKIFGSGFLETMQNK
jgi:hypothetical protein